jgi:hypothetical protein
MKYIFVYEIDTFYICSVKTIKDYETYSINPSVVFVEDTKVINYIKKGELKQFYNIETGEEVNYQEMGVHDNRTVDSREYRKVYVDGLPSISLLSSAGLKVWCYVLARIIARKDEVGINMEDCMEYTGYKTRANVYSGIVNLLENKLLFRKIGSGIFYININVFFNGNRIK